MHSESNQTTLVGEDWEKYGTTKIEHSESFWTTLVGKDGKRHEITKVGLSELFQTILEGNNGKSANQSKLDILNKMPECSFPYTTHMLYVCPSVGMSQ